MPKSCSVLLPLLWVWPQGEAILVLVTVGEPLLGAKLYAGYHTHVTLCNPTNNPVKLYYNDNR